MFNFSIKNRALVALETKHDLSLRDQQDPFQNLVGLKLDELKAIAVMSKTFKAMSSIGNGYSHMANRLNDTVNSYILFKNGIYKEYVFQQKKQDLMSAIYAQKLLPNGLIEVNKDASLHTQMHQHYVNCALCVFTFKDVGERLTNFYNELCQLQVCHSVATHSESDYVSHFKINVLDIL